MDRTVFTLLLSLWSSGLGTEDTNSLTVVPDDVRLAGGASNCAGYLEKKQQGDWKPVTDEYREWTLTSAAVVCRRLNCGSVVSLQRTQGSSGGSIVSDIAALFNLKSDGFDSNDLKIICSDSVRLVNGTNLCSGRLELKSNQSWSSVCQVGFGQQDAEVVCRELGCGAPSVLQGALYGEGEAPMWTKEFQCEGHESALLDCPSSVRTCSSGKAVGLTCSEPGDVRLFGGAGQCGGMLEINKLGEWKPVDAMGWNLMSADLVCRQLNCGSAFSIGKRETGSNRNLWSIRSDCEASSVMKLMKCLGRQTFSSAVLEITCSDSVRLLNGTSPCSGRLAVKSKQSDQSDQRWSSVCEDDFDQQDAQVVCRELGCGAPSVLQGAPYGEGEAPTWTKEFQCGGHESALLDCRRSDSARNTCSPGRAVGLTCSEPDDVRLVGGISRCNGRLEMKHLEDWRAVDKIGSHWDLKVASVICQWLGCGPSVSAGRKKQSSEQSVWWINSFCLRSQAALRECVTTNDVLSSDSLEITCSDSVRLVNETSRCSGKLEVKSVQDNQPNQTWSSVCEDDFDQQDAEVVCRELGCGAPSVHQGGLYGEGGAPMGTKQFQCEGHESALLDCGGSASPRDAGTPCKAVGLVCSDPDNIRLVGENSRCAGTLEINFLGEWRPVADSDGDWDESPAAVVCRLLNCGSVVSTRTTDDAPDRFVWWIKPSCVQSASALLDCVILTSDDENYLGLEVVCSDLLDQPTIFPSPSTNGVSKATQQGRQVLLGSDFTIMCSVAPQYPGGSFQLLFAALNAAQNRTLPAVNHSAQFLFSAVDQNHQGDYSCVYHIYVFNHNFSSESQQLRLTVGASLTELIVRLVVLLLGVASLVTTTLCYHSKASRIQALG